MIPALSNGLKERQQYLDFCKHILESPDPLARLCRVQEELRKITPERADQIIKDWLWVVSQCAVSVAALNTPQLAAIAGLSERN